MQDALTAIPSIETERLTLRAPRPSDAGLVSLYAGDARVARMTESIPHPYPAEAAGAFVRRATERPDGKATWTIEGKGLSEVLGMVTLTPVGDRRCEIGFWIAPAFWSAGFASEALTGLLEANPLGCRAIFASVFQDNPVSARILTALGFAYVGDAETHCVARDARVATWTYSRCMA